MAAELVSRAHETVVVPPDRGTVRVRPERPANTPVSSPREPMRPIDRNGPSAFSGLFRARTRVPPVGRRRRRLRRAGSRSSAWRARAPTARTGERHLEHVPVQPPSRGATAAPSAATSEHREAARVRRARARVESDAVLALGALLKLRVDVERHLRVGVANLDLHPSHVDPVGQDPFRVGPVSDGCSRMTTVSATLAERSATTPIVATQRCDLANEEIGDVPRDVRQPRAPLRRWRNPLLRGADLHPTVRFSRARTLHLKAPVGRGGRTRSPREEARDPRP
jgi:hypothetical protein